jgi:beta-carotene hydroxylase
MVIVMNGPRYPADWRTLAWVAAMPIIAGAQYLRPELLPFLAPLSCYLALTAGVIAHNHNHCPTFRSRRQNIWFAHVLSAFYGYPTFAWIPTHNLNHHKFVNRAGDATITWRHTNAHNWLVASTYFFVSSYWQSEPIKDFIRKARASNRRLYRQIIREYVLWIGVAIGLLALAIGLHGLRRGLLVWTFATAVPALFALWTIMLFNYVQHVHTDPWSTHNHSRSFTSPLLNFLLFNNGYHTAHHENPGSHWSLLAGLHEQIAPQIEPCLMERSMWWFFVRTYIVALFIPRLGTHQVGRAPFDPPDGRAVDIRTADVILGEAGTNAPMA